ncbi:MAG: HelD family protein [Bacillota bacterium]
MDSYQENLREEMSHLEKTVTFIRRELKAESEYLSGKRSQLIASRRDMWENTAHFTNDFDKLTEINQHLSEVNYQAANYLETYKQLEKYQRIINSPYFGRFDFAEDGSSYREKIYIGLHTVADSKTHDVYVYDWRAPISSIFYRYEPGRAEYSAPAGVITGDVLLKRQYKIQNGKLEHFFDCSIAVTDEILQKILSRNASAEMKNIVETIQKEQDLVIRDTESELLMVQGVAGSGKTSVALHRIAFLLYEGLNSNLKSNNILILSPNTIFSKYISKVLPGLGEENIEQATFEDIASKAFGERFAVESRSDRLESVINCRDSKENDHIRQSIHFKGSREFIKILDRLIRYYGHRLIPFEDVYYNGTVLMTGQQLKNRFLNNKAGIPMALQLQRLESVIWEKIHPLQKTRIKTLEKIVANSEGHDLEIKPFSRLLSIKETKKLENRLHRFTKVDYWNIYHTLFNKRDIFFRLAKGLELPGNIDRIISETSKKIQQGQIRFEDCAPLLYLKLKIEGYNPFPDIKQVVIDEAQDYYPLQYEVFKLLFKAARFTILGDIHQSIEKDPGQSFYDEIAAILNKPKTIQLFLNKGYRSSYPINTFTQKILGNQQNYTSLERHGEKPLVLHKKNEELIDQAIIKDIDRLGKCGYESVAIICKSRQEAERVYTRLKDRISVILIDPHCGKVKKGVLVIPSYLAKGLEFDAVIVYGGDRRNYSGPLDKKLLYIACTRALHRLIIYYTGEKSLFL